MLKRGQTTLVISQINRLDVPGRCLVSWWTQHPDQIGYTTIRRHDTSLEAIEAIVGQQLPPDRKWEPAVLRIEDWLWSRL